MRVRRKSEVAEAVEVKPGHWSVDGYRMTDEYFRAHYEPVPEPPAKFKCVSCNQLIEPLCPKCVVAINELVEKVEAAAPSVSEEQPWPKENQVMKPAPHRATIAMIPCYCHEGCKIWYISIDGEKLREGGPAWHGTEAEAKAKLESLSNHEVKPEKGHNG